MWELISLFRRASADPPATPLQQLEQSAEPEYFVELLDYLRERKKEQSNALRAAITALADAN